MQTKNKKEERLSWVFALLTGLIFGFGLSLSGMTDPRKVLAFLDIGGAWDPSLAFVMIGAIAVHALSYHLWLKKRARPFLASAFSLPSLRAIDARLISGAAIFGVGWGIGGFCPGPALVSLMGGSASALLFMLAMLGGMLIPQKTGTLSPLAKGAEDHGPGSRVL